MPSTDADPGNAPSPTAEDGVRAWWAPVAFALACTTCVGITGLLVAVAGLVGALWFDLLVPALVLLALVAWMTRGFGLLDRDGEACEVPEDG